MLDLHPFNMERTILSLGSNLGDSQSILQKAIASLIKHGERIVISDMYTTAPWGNADQPDFLNCAISMWVSCTPLQLLKRVQQIEQQFGRERKEHWGARTLDIDIILFGSIISKASTLTLPHPHFKDRNFVLIPMRDLNRKAPFREFALTKGVEQLIVECKDKSNVIKIEKVIK